MSESTRLWRCAACGRLLRQQSEDYARARLRSQVAAGATGAVEFVQEAMWPAYLASLRRCRCGSRGRLRPVQGASLRGQLALHLDAVVLQ